MAAPPHRRALALAAAAAVAVLCLAAATPARAQTAGASNQAVTRTPVKARIVPAIALSLEGDTSWVERAAGRVGAEVHVRVRTNVAASLGGRVLAGGQPAPPSAALTVKLDPSRTIPASSTAEGEAFGADLELGADEAGTLDLAVECLAVSAGV